MDTGLCSENFDKEEYKNFLKDIRGIPSLCGENPLKSFLFIKRKLDEEKASKKLEAKKKAEEEFLRREVFGYRYDE